MAFQADNTLISNGEMIRELVLAPFRAIGRGFEFLIENNHRAQALNALCEMSDEELAAKGTTREEAVQRLVGAYF